MVEIHVFACPKINAHTNNIALVGCDVDQLELPVEAANSGVGFAAFGTRLDAETDTALVAEIERWNRVRDERRSPVVHKQIEAAQLVEIVRAGVVAAREVRFGTVIEV